MNAIRFYRIERWFYLHNLILFAKIIRGGIFFLFNSFIPYTCEIGNGTTFGYKGMGVVIHSRAVIGRDCTIAQQVTIGGRSGIYEVPVIGDNVYLGAGCKVLGNVKIGNNSIVGANAVVLHDVPDNAVVAGIPARIIRINQK